MPITVMLDTNDETFPEGAYCVVPGTSHGGGHQPKLHECSAVTGRPYWTGVLVLAETHQGLCLQDHERNGYHDSDFCMTVWNPEKGCGETIGYASTRGWSYPCYASRVDATPEVRAAWEAWKAQERRSARVRGLVEARRLDRLLASDLGLPSYLHAHRLRLALGQHRPATEHEIGRYTAASRMRSSFLTPLNPEFAAVAQLLRTRNFKSEFRASLAQQAREWAANANHPRPRPLTDKQLRFA